MGFVEASSLPEPPQHWVDRHGHSGTQLVEVRLLNDVDGAPLEASDDQQVTILAGNTATVLDVRDEQRMIFVEFNTEGNVHALVAWDNVEIVSPNS